MNVRHRARAAFTLIELLVVIVIIVILIGILVPVINKARIAAYAASTSSLIQSMSGAILQYQQAYGAFPGPLPLAQLYPNAVNNGGTPPIYDSAGTLLTNVTGAENLVLGLMGGLKPHAGGPGFDFDRNLLGSIRILNMAAPKKREAFLSNVPLTERPGALPTAANLGKYLDDGGEANDSNIPEIIDKFPNAMPILYLRAQVGAAGVVAIAGKDSNGAVLPGQYDLNEAIPYTGSTIGAGKNLDQYYAGSANPTTPKPTPYHGLRTVDVTRTMTVPGPTYFIPADAYPYFLNPSMPNTPRQKDGYILISAGKDRVYGTADDITNYGSVVP